jgi:hypothetical protein
MARRSYKRQSARSKQILAEKRRAAKILRQAGLLQRRGKKITAEYLRSSSYFNRVRREFADLLSGEVRAAKINLEGGRLLRAAGYRVRHGKVIVPKATKPIRPGQVGRLALQAPPRAPTAPRPRRSRRAVSDVMIQQIIEWYQAGFNREGIGQTRFGKRNDLTEAKYARLLQMVNLKPILLAKIVEKSRSDNQRYLEGKGPAHQQELPEPEDELEEEIMEEVLEDFPELFFYHHPHGVVSGMIWGDLTMTWKLAS